MVEQTVHGAELAARDQLDTSLALRDTVELIPKMGFLAGARTLVTAVVLAAQGQIADRAPLVINPAAVDQKEMDLARYATQVAARRDIETLFR